MRRSIEDFDSIRQRAAEIANTEGRVLLAPLAIATGPQLDEWAKIAGIPRSYGETDDSLRERVRQHLKC